MLGLCSRGSRALECACPSSKCSEEIALAPMTSCSDCKSRSVLRRNPRKSLKPNNATDMSSTTPLVNIVRSVSLVLREVDRRLNMQPAWRSGFHDLRQLEQFGTDIQPQPPGRVGIDFKSHFVVLGNKIDNPAVFGKAVNFAHGQCP